MDSAILPMPFAIWLPTLFRLFATLEIIDLQKIEINKL